MMESNTIQDMENGSNFTAVELENAVGTDNVTTGIEKYAVPAICTFGLVGNSVSAFVFSRRPLRNNPSSLFLVARSISDNGFLATLLIIWYSSLLNLSIGNVSGLCQVLIFLTYFFGCLSVWLVVLVTVENYIRICKPLLVSTVCKTIHARASVIVLLVLTVTIYNFPLWTMREQCVPYKTYYSFIQVMTYIDSVLTLIVPSTVMVVLMMAITATAIASCNRRSRSSSFSNVKSRLTKVTTMLLAVTITFLILNLPYHAVRLRLMIIIFVQKQNLETEWVFEQTLRSLSQMLYYLSLSINVVVYTIFSSKFRAIVKDFFQQTRTHTEVHRLQRIPELQGDINEDNETSHLQSSNV